MTSQDSILRHLVLLLVHPHAQWQAIARQTISVLRLLFAFVVPFSCLTALAVSMGVTFFDTTWDAQFGYHLQPAGLPVLVATILGFSIGSVVLLAAVFTWIAPMYERPRHFVEALKVATFGSLPVWIASAALVVLPGVVVVVVAFGYSCYLYTIGLREVLGTSTDEAPEYLAISLIFHGLTASALGAFAAWLGWL
jgi:hypothetical protein